jgi:putative ABC transport system permease protein
VTSILRDLRQAGRVLAKAPGFSFAALATLAVAVGLNGLVFTFVNALLFRPLPVRSPDRLVRIYSVVPGEPMSHAPMSLPDFRDLRRQCPSFSAIAASFLTTLAVEDDESGRLAVGELVTPNYFTTLGVEPALGRAFAPTDVTAAERGPFGGPAVAVLSHAAWRRRFGGDPSVVGRRIRLNGHPFTVAGVAPKEFFGLARGVSPELWLPMAEDESDRAADRDTRSFWLVGRLRPGVSLARACAEVDTVARRLREEHPDTNRDRAFAVLPSRAVRVLPGIDQSLYPASFASLALAGLLLLVACSNLAHLLLVRALGRRAELTTRLALGARRAALVRQLLGEGLLLSLLGGGLGLLFAAGAPLVLAALPASLPVDVELGLGVDWRVVAFTLSASTLTTLAFAVAPALEATRIDLSTALRSAGLAAGSRRRRLRDVLLVSQLAFSLVLLACAGLFVRSVLNARRTDPGFDARGVVVASFAPRLQGYTSQRSEDLYRRLLTEIRAQPDTVAAGLASHLPLSVEITYERVADVFASRPPDEWPTVDTALVSPGYFQAMGIPILEGRPFDEGDALGSAQVVVVNDTLADRLWPGRSPLGQRVRIAGVMGTAEVVGRVASGRYRTIGEAPRPFLFRAFAQAWRDRVGRAGEVATGSQTLVVRSRARPAVAQRAIREAAGRIDDTLAISRLTTLAEATSLPLLLPRAAASLFGVLGLIALGLAAVGVVGMAAHSAACRTREIGVRMALGARRGDIVRLFLREGLSLVALALALGLAAVAATARALASLLYGVRPLDPASCALASAALAAVALAGIYVPARRAARLEPQAALRHE